MTPGKPEPRRGVLDISAYVPGDDRSSATRVFKLSSNETPLGPSPLAVEAYRRNADRLHIYPEGSARQLRDAIAAAYGLNPERITGATPHQYLLRTRLRHAALRIRRSEDKIIDIALHAGFGDLSNFNRAFRVEFGVSPRAYRRG